MRNRHPGAVPSREGCSGCLSQLLISALRSNLRPVHSGLDAEASHIQDKNSLSSGEHTERHRQSRYGVHIHVGMDRCVPVAANTDVRSPLSFSTAFIEARSHI